MKKFCSALAVLTLTAWADTPVTGDWTSSGGVFHIPSSSGRFQLTLTSSNREVKKFQANWVVPGEKFTWVDAQNANHSVELQAKNKPVRFKDVGEAFPDSPGYWYRKTP